MTGREADDDLRARELLGALRFAGSEFGKMDAIRAAFAAIREDERERISKRIVEMAAKERDR